MGDGGAYALQQLSAARESADAWKARALVAEAECERLVGALETAEDDVLRFMVQRNLALEIAAEHLQPGPDGQDYIDRARMIREWVDEAWERYEGGSKPYGGTDRLVEEADAAARAALQAPESPNE